MPEICSLCYKLKDGYDFIGYFNKHVKTCYHCRHRIALNMANMRARKKELNIAPVQFYKVSMDTSHLNIVYGKAAQLVRNYKTI